MSGCLPPSASSLPASCDALPAVVLELLQASEQLIGIFDAQDILRFANPPFQQAYHARPDGRRTWGDIMRANYLQQLRYLYLPHLGRSVAVVVMIELIFLLSIFAEIYTTTGGGPGDASTNVTFLIFKQALLNFDAGVASAGALFAVVLANIAAVFLIRMVGKNLDK